MPAKPTVVTDPLTNRGTAFTEEERRRLGLIGRFPSAVETLDQQATRTYAQLNAQPTNLDKYVFLDQLHDRNEVLHYRVLTDHLTEFLSIVYDPPVGEAIKKWSREYRRSRAVYRSIDRIGDVHPSFGPSTWGPRTSTSSWSPAPRRSSGSGTGASTAPARSSSPQWSPA